MRRILVVDDNKAIRDSLVDALGDEGFDVTCVDNGHAALESVRKALPSLVLLDLMMPDWDGATVAQRLAEAGCRAPIIVVSADRSGEARARAMGAVGFLPKPFDLPSLLRLIESLGH